MNPGEQSLHQRKFIPHGRANHRECTGLPCGITGKRNRENPRSIERRELRGLWCPTAQGGTAKMLEVHVGQSKARHLQTRVAMRNMIHCWKGSQWSTSSM